MRTTTVSIRGNKQYIRALRLIAEKKGVHIGDIVREAVDEKYATDISVANEQLSLILPDVSHASDKNHSKVSEVA